MLHTEPPPSSLSIRMPLSTRVIFPVVSAFKQISLSSPKSNRRSLNLQGEDMVTDKEEDQAHSQEVHYS